MHGVLILSVQQSLDLKEVNIWKLQQDGVSEVYVFPS
jgi:hypothetical protein